MNWVKLANSVRDNPKMLDLSDGAFRLYICALCYSNEHLTDGNVSRRALEVVSPGLRNAAGKARELVTQGLWVELDGGGWQIHDYFEFQRSARQVQDVRRKDRARKAATDSVDTLHADSIWTPDGIQMESNGTPDGLARSREKRREEKNTSKAHAKGWN